MKNQHAIQKPVKISLFILFSIVCSLNAQQIRTPLEKNNFARPSSYEELSDFTRQLDESSGLVTVETAGRSVRGRNLYAIKFSSSEFGKDKAKIKVLIFAQQHGDEQSGKDGALLLARELILPENRYLFEKLDLMIIPQMNPDGSEANNRVNSNDADLNRNHLILTEPETIALHQLFDRYLFEVAMDVHEYSPYGKAWKNYGYRDNSDELLGTPTNINVSSKIRNLANRDFMPYLKNYCSGRHISCFVYAPGGPPEIRYIRHSTFDINDGRQSLAIQNTFSFILEGKNGEDDFAENIRHRAEGQMTAMRGLLEYTYLNAGKIKKLITGERGKLISGKSGEKIPVQLIHAANGQKLDLPVYSYRTGKDSVITVNDYRPVVKSIFDVDKTEGYLVPVADKDLTDWVERQAFRTEPAQLKKSCKIEQYSIESVDSIDFEGDMVINPTVSLKEYGSDIKADDFIYVPTAQLKGILLVIALEPKSMLGLATYPQFAYLVKAGTTYRILRVAKKE
jgi:hypothetical protein